MRALCLFGSGLWILQHWQCVVLREHYGHPYWQQGLLVSPSVPAGPVASDQDRKQWWLEPVVCTHPDAEASSVFCVVAGAGYRCTHMWWWGQGRQQRLELTASTLAAVGRHGFWCALSWLWGAWQWRLVMGILLESMGRDEVDVQLEGLAVSECSGAGQWQKTGLDLGS